MDCYGEWTGTENELVRMMNCSNADCCVISCCAAGCRAICSCRMSCSNACRCKTSCSNTDRCATSSYATSPYYMPFEIPLLLRVALLQAVAVQIVVNRIVVKQSPLLRVALFQAVVVQIGVDRIVVCTLHSCH
jgi:hypothetical protein